MGNAPHSSTAPFAVAVFGIATFAGMDVVMKGLAIELGAYNAMLWRTLIALSMSSSLFLLRRNSWPQVEAIKVHVWRGVVTSLMAFLFFWALVYIPLAEAIALSFIAPLIALYLAAVLLGEKISSSAIVASVLGLIGAAIIIQGKLSGEYSEEVGLGIAAILFSAVLYAYNLILQRQQALIAEPVEIAMFQNGTVVLVYLLFAPFLAVVPPATQLPMLGLAAGLGLVSLLLVSWAYARAEARILIPVEYTAFIWASLFGWLIYAEEVTTATLAGTALIVVGCLLAARQHPEDVEHIETTAL
jgi:drug/metabolite transporter (DMT)-like permease